MDLIVEVVWISARREGTLLVNAEVVNPIIVLLLDTVLVVLRADCARVDIGVASFGLDAGGRGWYHEPTSGRIPPLIGMGLGVVAA